MHLTALKKTTHHTRGTEMGASSKALTLTMSHYELEIIKARVSRLSTTYVLLFLALHLKIDVHPSFNYYFHSQFSLRI